MFMKLRNIDLRGRRNPRIEENGKNKAQNEKGGASYHQWQFRHSVYHNALLSCQATITRAIFRRRCRGEGFKTCCTANSQIGKPIDFLGVRNLATPMFV